MTTVPGHAGASATEPTDRPEAPAPAGRPDALVFDLDGTLVDSVEDILDAFVHAFGSLGMTVPPRDELRATVGRPLEEIFPRYAAAPLVPVLIGAYREHYPRIFTRTSRPYPGVVDTLAELRRRGYLLAVATSKRTAMARRFVDAMGLADALDHVQGTDGFPAKPAPDVIQHALSALGARGVWMVGDTVHDVRAGRAAGVRTLALTWGVDDAAALVAAGPDRVADRIEALLDLVPSPG